ncbi:hypothetical protein K3495_g2088 [Podosphaera aphanis]|nr:hypothetical protein K3495_g2088 [Podosphaera aphanis]
MKDPAVHHGIALKSLMRYLRSTIKQRLRFGPCGAHPDKSAVCTDADWATDKSGRKSISGGVCLYYGGPISCSSKKQTSVATSSAEAEYISQAMYAKQDQWIAQILRDTRMQQIINENATTVPMYGDDQGALALIKNSHLHEQKKRLTMDYVPTIGMLADGITKPLQRVAFERFKKHLGIVDGPGLQGLS